VIAGVFVGRVRFVAGSLGEVVRGRRTLTLIVHRIGPGGLARGLRQAGSRLHDRRVFVLLFLSARDRSARDRSRGRGAIRSAIRSVRAGAVVRVAFRARHLPNISFV